MDAVPIMVGPIMFAVFAFIIGCLVRYCKRQHRLAVLSHHGVRSGGALNVTTGAPCATSGWVMPPGHQQQQQQHQDLHNPFITPSQYDPHNPAATGGAPPPAPYGFHPATYSSSNVNPQNPSMGAPPPAAYPPPPAPPAYSMIAPPLYSETVPGSSSQLPGFSDLPPSYDDVVKLPKPEEQRRY